MGLYNPGQGPASCSSHRPRLGQLHFSHFLFTLISAFYLCLFCRGIICYSPPGCSFSILISLLAISPFSTLFQGKQQPPQVAAGRFRLKAGQLPPHSQSRRRCWVPLAPGGAGFADCEGEDSSLSPDETPFKGSFYSFSLSQNCCCSHQSF